MVVSLKKLNIFNILSHFNFPDKTDLDVGPHLEEQHGVDDGHPGGAVHANIV